MRIYKTLYEAYKETERELIEMGTIVKVQSMQDIKEEFETKELQGYSYCITENYDMNDDFERLKGNMMYAESEFLDRVDPKYLNPGHSYLERPKVWNVFLHEGKFSYTYNSRLRTQLPIIIEELKKNPHTRQAILTIYDQHQDIENLGGKARIPCSMYYQLLRRERKGEEVLDAIYTMRSCDLYTHMIYDIWLGMSLQEFIANAVGIIPGHFIHFIGSLHAYKQDYEKKGVF